MSEKSLVDVVGEVWGNLDNFDEEKSVPDILFVGSLTFKTLRALASELDKRLEDLDNRLDAHFADACLNGAKRKALTARVDELEERQEDDYDRILGYLVSVGWRPLNKVPKPDSATDRADLVERVRQARGKYRCGIDGFPVGGTLGDWARLVRAIDALLAHEDQEARDG